MATNTRIPRSKESSRSQRIVESMRVIAHGVTHRDGGGVSTLTGALSSLSVSVFNLTQKIRRITPTVTSIYDLNSPEDPVVITPPGPRGKQGKRGLQGPPGMDFMGDGLDVPLQIPGQRGLTGLTGAVGSAGATGARGPAGGGGIPALILETADDIIDHVGNTMMPNNRGNLPMWTMLLNEDGTSLSNWTQTSGSWSVASSAFHIDTGATTVRQLSFTTGQPQSGIMFEAQVQMVSTGGFAADNRVGLIINNGATAGSPGSLVTMRSTGALTPSSTGKIYCEGPSGVTAGPTTANNFNLDQFYTLKLVAIGPVMDVYIDGVYKNSFFHIPFITTTTAYNPCIIGLYAYNCRADFKNIKLWQLNPASTITAGGTTYQPTNFNPQIMRNLCQGRLTLASGIPYYCPQQALHSSTDTTAETVTMATAHGWKSGTIVIPNTTIGGLTANTSYFVNVVNSTTVSFHTNVADALAGTSKVNLTANVVAWFHPTGIGNTNVYFSPFNGNQIGIYNGTYWTIRDFSELTLAVGTLTSDKNYDVFVYDSAGNLTLEAVAWSSDTARTTDIVLQDGVYVKSGATERRYLGTFRTDSTTTTIDAQTKRFVWNFYNQQHEFVRRRETTSTWTLNSTSYRQANAGASNQVAVVVGVSNISMIDLSIAVHSTNPSSGGNKGFLSIGEDSTANPLQGILDQSDMGATASLDQTLSTRLYKSIPLGYHTYVWLEACLNTGGNVTFKGTGELETARPTGMLGWIQG